MHDVRCVEFLAANASHAAGPPALEQDALHFAPHEHGAAVGFDSLFQLARHHERGPGRVVRAAHVVVHEHDGAQDGGRLGGRGVAVGGAQLVEELEDAGVFEIAAQQVGDAAVHEAQDLQVRPRMGFDLRHHPLPVHLVGRGERRRADDDVAVQPLQIGIEALDGGSLAGEQSREVVGEPVQVGLELDARPGEVEGVHGFVADDVDGFFQRVEHEAVRVEAARPEPEEHGRPLVEQRVATLEGPAGPAGMGVAVEHAHGEPALRHEAGRREPRKPRADDERIELLHGTVLPWVGTDGTMGKRRHAALQRARCRRVAQPSTAGRARPGWGRCGWRAGGGRERACGWRRARFGMLAAGALRT